MIQRRTIVMEPSDGVTIQPEEATPAAMPVGHDADPDGRCDRDPSSPCACEACPRRLAEAARALAGG